MTALSSPQWPLDDLCARLRADRTLHGNEAADRLEKAEGVRTGCCVKCHHFAHSVCFECGMSDRDCMDIIWPEAAALREASR